MVTIASPAELQSFLNDAVSSGVPGIVAAIGASNGQVLWRGAAGLSDVQSAEPMQIDRIFGIGSITKVFVAVVVLQLAQERRLRLDQTAGGILGEVTKHIANANQATLEQLINHTSGIPSWEDAPRWIRDARGLHQDVRRIWGKRDALQYIEGSPALGAPGERYYYSNTNYTLLGLIIEELTGEEAMSVIRKRILIPLRLSDTILEGFEQLPSGRVPSRYHWATNQFRCTAGVAPVFRQVQDELIDVSCSNVSAEWLAGGMVSSATDLVRFGVALRDGRLLDDESMAFVTAWRQIGPNVEVEHNLYRRSYAGGPATIGHTGGVLGFGASLYWIEGVDILVDMMCNVGTTHAGTVPFNISSDNNQEEFVKRLITGVDRREPLCRRTETAVL